MPIKNFDDLAKVMFEPITIVVDGVTYSVGKVTAEMVGALSKDDQGTDIGVVCRQLAKIVGVKPNTFMNTDLRIVTAALQFVTEEATKQMGETPPKNPTQDEVKS